MLISAIFHNARACAREKLRYIIAVRQNTRYDYALDTVPAPPQCEPTWEPEPESPEEELCHEAARMARVMIEQVVSAAEGSGEACLMMLMRGMGLSLAEIAARTGVSKQAVHKRLRGVARRHPVMEAYLRLGGGNPLDERAWGDARILEMSRKHAENRRRLAAWMND